MRRSRWILVSVSAVLGAALAGVVSLLLLYPDDDGPGGSVPITWRLGWSKTDFSRRSIDLDDIISGGPPKDGIPSIDDPRFTKVSAYPDLPETEPVIGLVIGGEAKAYPIRDLMWHEIVNDVVAGVPVTVTYCPLCNSAVVFDRRAAGQVLEFGTTGKLRHSDMVMYDRQTESWWQQFLGEAIVGELLGTRLKKIPARMESFAEFKKRAPRGEVLIPNHPSSRRYGVNPYVGYDRAPEPFLFQGSLPDYINPMVRVVVVGDKAWSLPYLVAAGPIRDGDLTLSWRAGQNSALDTKRIRDGRDVGNVIARRGLGRSARDVVYDVTFAFVYNVFHPEKRIITE